MKKLILTMILPVLLVLPVSAGWRSLETITRNVGTSEITVTSSYTGVWEICTDAIVNIDTYGNSQTTTHSFVLAADTNYHTGFNNQTRILSAGDEVNLKSQSGTANVIIRVIDIKW